MRKRRILGMLLVTLLLSAWGTSASAELNEVEAAQYGVVRVYTDIGQEYCTGTGFAVGLDGAEAQYFVTNNHVVEDNTDNVYITVTDIEGLIPAKVLATDVKWDLAILRIEKPLSNRNPLPIVPSKTVKKGETVYALGFPGQGDYSDKGDRLASEIDDITVTKGSASKIVHILDGVSYIYSDVTVNGGNSGGPMVNEHGHVIGVNAATIQGENDRTAMSLAIHTEYVAQMLTSLSIPYEMIDPDSSSERKEEEPVTADEQVMPEGETPEQDREENGSKNNKPIVFGATASVVAVIVVLALVYRMRKTRKKPVADSSYPHDEVGKGGYHVDQNKKDDDSMIVQSRKLAIRIESGPMAGRVITGEGPIYVGRNNPNCQISYPSGTPGVSKQHCCIEVTPYGIQITDMGSSYGTYVNRKRIPSHSQTNIGEGGLLYIGSDRVTLSVSATNR